MRFLDNVLTDFISRAPDSFKHAKYAAMRERSVGLGVMGFHSFLQKNSIPLESVMSKSWNNKIFKHIQKEVENQLLKNYLMKEELVLMLKNMVLKKGFQTKQR